MKRSRGTRRGVSLRRALVGSIGVAVLASAGCGAQPGGSSDPGTLSVVNASGSLWTCNYNPYAPVTIDTNLIYEPLYFINDLNGEENPWLATDYEWSKDNLELTLTLRSDVKWNDGKPFTASDVEFNFDLMKEEPATDLYALWSDGVLKEVTADGDDKVVFEFAKLSTSSLRYILSTRIHPEHIWSKISNPVEAKTTKQVGTGPYKIESCTAQAVTYVKNPDFWQPGKPKVEKILYPAFVDNQGANRNLAQGRGDWGGQFVPNVEDYWIAKDPENRKTWYPAVSNVAIAVNVTEPYLDDKLVRQALSYAVDRGKVSEKGMYGYQKPASQTAVVDSFSDWRDETAEAEYDYGYDCATAQDKLTEAGFTKDDDGMFVTPDGKPFQPELINNAGFTDWVASVQIIGQSMQECGIDVQVKNLSGQQFDDRRLKGQFELSYDSQSSGPNPYFELRNWLFGKLTKPIGEDTLTNHGRWQDAATDDLIRAYDQTLDTDEQHQIVGELQGIMLEEVPFIPVTQNVSWSQMDHSRFKGWPSEDDPYANPAPYSANWEQVLLRLEPVKGS